MMPFTTELDIEVGYRSMFLSHNYARIKVDSYDSLPLEKILTFHEVIISIKSVLNWSQKHYSYDIFLEKCSYQLAKI